MRAEHGYFSYNYEPCNVGNIRKMVVVLPKVQPLLSPLDIEKYRKVKDRPDILYKFAAKYPML